MKMNEIIVLINSITNSISSNYSSTNSTNKKNCMETRLIMGSQYNLFVVKGD